MQPLRKDSDGFYLSDSHLLEYLHASSWDGKLVRTEIRDGATSITLTSTRSCLEASSLSSRHHKIRAVGNGKPVFLAVGFLLKSRTSRISSAAVYDAADQMGEEEADEMAAILDAYPCDELFSKRSLFVVSAWEALDTSQAISVLSAVCLHLKSGIVALDCGPKHLAEPPRPDAKPADHIAYRAALDLSLAEASRVAQGLINASQQTLLFTRQLSRTPDEQILELIARTMPKLGR